MITVTLNPSLDRTLDTETFAVGEVNRAVRTHLDAGGKGINVSRGLHQHGIDTVAVFPIGGPDGQVLVGELAAVGVPVHPVPIAGAIRSNVTIADVSGVTTKINAPGPRISAVELDTIAAAVLDELDRGACAVIVAGSLPEGVPTSFVTRLGAIAAERRVPFVVDTSGAPLVDAVAAGGLSVVKPNDEELAELVGRELASVGDVQAAAGEVLSHGNDAVLVSLGAHGALLVTPEGSWWAGGAPLVPLSTVGAGDSTLAGWLATTGAPPAGRLRTAVAWGRAAVQLPGTEMPAPHHIDLASVRVVADPDPALTLKEL
jgi:1-phosphofructokinase